MITLCGKEFKKRGVAIHEAACKDCMIIARQLEEPAKEIRLTPDDVFCKSSMSGFLKTQSYQRQLRKNAERFHRRCLRAKSKSRAKNAIRHGWVPKNDVRHRGDNQN